MSAAFPSPHIRDLMITFSSRLSTVGATAYGELVFQPKLVVDLRYVEGSDETPQGTAESSWTRSEHRFELTVTVPSNTTAEVWAPTDGRQIVRTRARATSSGISEKDYLMPLPRVRDDREPAVPVPYCDGRVAADPGPGLHAPPGAPRPPGSLRQRHRMKGPDLRDGDQ
jgi:hypothetical protein